jgi:hypothetical protein
MNHELTLYLEELQIPYQEARADFRINIGHLEYVS